MLLSSSAAIDTEEFLNDSSNMSIWDFNTVTEIEPAIFSVYDMPVGTAITLIRENNKKYFVHTDTGEYTCVNNSG
jgi:hypothetical protein